MNTDHSNPYIGPRTFQRNEGHLFYGRERESRDLLRLVVSEPLVLFYAQSGAGKSSIINTRLIPELESRSFEVLPIGRVSGDLPPDLEVENIYIYNLMHNLVQHETDPKVLAGLTLTKFLDGLLCDEEGYYYHEIPREIEAENGEEQGEKQEEERPRPSRRRMLIIDQFEELFSTHPEEWKKRDNFFRQLAQSMRDNPYIWVVLVMREDYIATLDPYAYLLPGGLRVRYYMQRLGREAALKAVKTPVESKRPYAPGVAEKLVDDLCSIKVAKPDGSTEMQLGQYVEPVQLQVICYNLWENLSEGTEITEKDLQEVGDVNTSLGNYYATRVKAVAEAKRVKERKIREWFSDKLIAPGGIRSMVMQESTPSAGGLDDDVIQALQSDLVRAEKRGGVTWYELTHDRLVEPILENNRDWFNEHLSPLQRQAALWRDQERNDSWLLVDQALSEVEEWAQEHPDEMTEIEEELLSACRKHQLRVNEIREMQQRELEMAQNLAKEQERLAEEQRKSAEQALQMADEQQRFAREQERYAQEQAQSAKRARLLTTIAFTLFALAIVAVGFAVAGSNSAQKSAATSATNEAIAQTERKTADSEREKADALYNSARARELASAAKSSLDSQPDLSILLSLEAYKAVEDLEDVAPEAQSALFNSMQRALRLRRYLATSEDPADELRYSPNGKFVALLKKDGITLWDVSATDLKEPTTPIKDTNAINKFASGDKFIFSPDSSQLIYLTHQGLNAWDIKNQKSLSTAPINDHTGAVQQILFLGSEGKTFATRGENGEVTLWDLEQSGVKQKPQSYHGDNVVLDPKGNKLAILDNQKGEITVFDLTTSKQALPPNSQEPNTVTSLAFNQNGDVLAIGLEKGSVVLWDLKDNSTKTINSQQTSDILSLVFDSSGKYITYSTLFGAWRLDVENPPTPGNAGASLGYPIAFSENGDKLVYPDNSTNTNQLKLWDVAQNQPITAPIASRTLTLSPDSKYLAVYDEAIHTIGITDSSKPNDPPVQLATDIPVNYMTFSRDGKLLAVGASDGRIQVWDIIANTELIRSDEPQSGLVTSFVFSPDDSRLIAGKNDGTFTLLDINGTGKSIESKTGFTGKISSFGFSEDKKFLYSVAQDGILLIDPSTLLPRGHVVPGTPLDGDPLRFITTANGKQLLATRDRDNVILWDIEGDRPFGDTIQGYSAYLSQNKKFIVISQEITEETKKASVPDQPQKATNLVLLDVATGKPFSTPIKGEYAYFSSDDQFVAISNSKDGTLTLWNTANPEPLDELKGPFAQLQFVPGHDLLAMVKDSNILFWSASPLEQKGDPSKPIKGNFVIFSPDGEVFAATTYSPTPGITLWNTATLEQIGQPIPGTIPYPNSSPGSFISLFGIGEDQGTMVVQNNAGFTFWDIKTGNFLGGPIPQNVIYASPNYNYLAFSPYQPSYYSSYPTYGPSPYPAPPYTTYGSACSNYYYPSTYIWDVNNKEQISAIDVGIPQFSPDEKLVALKKCDSSILSLWDLTSGTQISGPVREPSKIVGNVAFDPPTAKAPNDIAFSPATNNTFAIFNTDGSVSLWNTPALPSLPGSEVKLEGFPGSIANLALTQDGGMLAVSTRDEIKLFKKKTDHTYAAASMLKNKHIKEMYTVQMSPDGTIVVAANNDSTLSLWNRAKDLQSSIPEAFYALSPDGKLLISSPDGRMFKLWDSETGKQIGNPVFGDSLQFSPDGKYLALNNYNGGYNITILDTASGTQIGDPMPGYYLLGFGSDNKTLIAGNNGYDISLLHIGESPNRPITISLSGSPKFSPDYGLVESAGSDGSFKIWDTLTGRPVGSIEGFFGEFRGFSPDNKLAYLYSYDKNGFILLDVPKQKIGKAEMKKIVENATIIPGSTASILTFSGDGKFMAAAQVDWYGNPTATWLWDVDQRKQIASISGSFKGFGISGKFLVTRTDSNTSKIEFLDSTDPTKKVRQTFEYPGSLNNVTISQDGNTLVAFGNEGIRLLDLTRIDNKLIILADDSGPAQQMSFSPDGSTLATLGSDGLSLWNVGDQTQVGSLIPGKAGRINMYRFTSDGKSITYIDQNAKVFTIGLENVEASSDEKRADATEKMSDVCTGVLSPSGRFVVKPSSKNKKLQIWDVNVPDKSFKDLELVGNCYSPMTFSPDESAFAYSDSDRIWIFTADKDGTPFSKTIGLIGKPEDGSSYVNLSFAADQELLLARTSSGRIFVWDIEKRTQLVATDLPAEPTVFADDKLLTYLRTENKLVLTDFDQDAWKKTLIDWKGILCEKVRPKLSQSEWIQYFSGEYATDYKSTCAP